MRPIEILENIFTNQISVLNISIPIFESSLEQARIICVEKNYDVQLVREGIQNDLQLYERSTNQLRNLVDFEVISESTPILDVIELLITYPQVFIKEKRKVSSIVTRSDLDSVPVRIWLFGMINILELFFRNKIASLNIPFDQNLPTKRLAKAQYQLKMKKEQNLEVSLLDCLQIADYQFVIQNNWELFQRFFTVKTTQEFEHRTKSLKKLRDELAHAQKLSLEWSDIYNLMNFAKLCLLRE